MDILIYTKCNNLLGLAERLRRSGHKVLVHSERGRPASVEKAHYAGNYLKGLQKTDFIISEGGGLPSDLYLASKRFNKPILGANKITDLLNADCVKEFDLVQKLKLPYPKTIRLDGAYELYGKVFDWDARFNFIKFDRSQLPCENQEWMAWSVTRVPDRPLLLQERVDGIRVNVEGWFNGFDWLHPFLIKSPEGISKSRLVVVEQKTGKLGKTALTPLAPFLKTINYRGPVTGKLIASADATWLYELQVGLDTASLYAMTEGLHGDLGQFLYQVAIGTAQNLNIGFDYCISSGAYAPEFRETPVTGAPIVGIKEGALNHMFLNSVIKADSDYLVDDASPLIYVVTSHGQTVYEASRRVSRCMDLVRFPAMLCDKPPSVPFDELMKNLGELNGS